MTFWNLVISSLVCGHGDGQLYHSRGDGSGAGSNALTPVGAFESPYDGLGNGPWYERLVPTGDGCTLTRLGADSVVPRET